MKGKGVRFIFVASALAGLMVILILTGIFPGGGTGSIGGLSSSGGEPQDPKWKESLNNFELLTMMTSLFINVEKRVPATYEELQNSNYMAVRAQDIINPYTLQPVQVVTSPSPGDITWAYNSPELTLGLYYEENGAVQHETLTYDSAYLQRVISYGDNHQNGSSQNEIRVTYSTEVFDSLVRGVLLRYYNSYRNPGPVPWPTTFEEFVADQSNLAKFYNPYTSGYMQNVPATQPSPGNFTFKITMENNTVKMYSIKFYGDNGAWILELNTPPIPPPP